VPRLKTIYKIVMLFFLLVPSQVCAQTYYIDYVGGNETNAGTSTGTPWKYCPGDDRITGSSTNDHTPEAGDIFIFKGGVVYTGSGSDDLIELTITGTSQNWITYRGNTEAGDWGSGKAKIDLNESYFKAFYSSGEDYINIKNFEIYGAKNAGGVVADSGIIDLRGGQNNWLIENCIIHSTEDWDTLCAQGSDSSVPSNNYAINIYGFSSAVDNVEVRGCELYALGSTIINVCEATNVDIHNCNFGGIERGAASGYFSVAIRVSYATSGLNIYDNTFHDGWQYEGDDPSQRCHAGDWIHIYGDNDGSQEANRDPHDIIIDSNYWYNNKDFSETHGTANIFVEDDAYNITYRNNVCSNPHKSCLTFGSTNGNVHEAYVYNNTFIDYTSPYTVSWSATNSGDSLEIKNNIFIHYTSSLSINSFEITTYIPTSDYNSNQSGITFSGVTIGQ
jgi:hypothetical protein